MATGQVVPTKSAFEFAEPSGTGTGSDPQWRISPASAPAYGPPQGGVSAAAQVVETGRGGVDFAFSTSDLNRMLPKTAMGVFQASHVWAELVVSSGWMPGIDCHCRQPQQKVVARRSFDLVGGVPARIDFSGHVVLQDAPELASVWTVVVQALGSFKPRGAKTRVVGGRLLVVGTLPLSLVVHTKRAR